jgi:hypothetical protein
MIARVKENAGRELSLEEVKEHVHRDFGVELRLSQPSFVCVRPRRGREAQL